ncbi:ABC transporter permease [Nocardioides sp. LHD-245]|uniref:ABC transporter permease n=1 Tax=Nocardioides sp. LHD-245 TaxID=3051387 RepID=UPI0027DFD339|nr:ABC transporter permease [Nocardioides sp. LHD-245]
MTTPPTTLAAPSEAALPRRRTSRTSAVVGWVMPSATVLLMAYFSVATSNFLTFDNLAAVLTQNAAVFIVAAAAAMLLMAGYADLSVGSMMALAGVSAGLAFTEHGVVAGLVVGLLVGLVVGTLNGVLIGVFEMSPIVVTLGGLAAWRALAQYLAPDSVFGFPDAVGDFAIGRFLGLTWIAWIAIVVCVVAVAVMALLPLGRHIQAIGVNARAAFLVGIRVKGTVLALYAVVGLAVGLAALLQIARLDSAPSGTLGVGFEVTVLTAVLLGGIPFTGGRGSMWRVLVGVWLIAVLKNGLTLLNYGPEVAGMVTGAVLVVAAALEAVAVAARRRG